MLGNMRNILKKHRKKILVSCSAMALSLPMSISTFAAETTATTTTSFLQEVGTFFTQSVTWLGNVLNTIVSNPPLLILCLAMPIVGFSVGLLGRLVRL